MILRVQGSGGRVDDVVVVVDPSHTVGELTVALCQHVDERIEGARLTSMRLGRSLRPDELVAGAGVMSGDELTVGPPGLAAGAPRLPTRAVSVDVTAGPDSGRSWLLPPGRYSIGRGTGVDLLIADPSVSRHHVDIEVGGACRATLIPRPSAANGVTVNDVEVVGATPLSGDDVVALGGSRFAFRAFERSGREQPERLGWIEFHRTPYRPPIVVERANAAIGPIPSRPEPRKLQVFAALAPLAAGLTMYAFTRQVQFLALTLISPIVMIATAIEERRSGRRNFGDRLVAFRADLVAVRRRVEALRHAERIDRLRAAPDLADLVRRAELRTIDLWSRGRGAPDFLRLRLGLGSARAFGSRSNSSPVATTISAVRPAPRWRASTYSTTCLSPSTSVGTSCSVCTANTVSSRVSLLPWPSRPQRSTARKTSRLR